MFTARPVYNLLLSVTSAFDENKPYNYVVWIIVCFFYEGWYLALCLVFALSGAMTLSIYHFLWFIYMYIPQ